ncbi:MAG: ABC transporter permease [Dehalococcoidia bacterium]|nr:ABC transporter permease [Dehalococcoidia bacterium]
MAQREEQATPEVAKCSALSLRSATSRLWVLSKRNPTMMGGIAIVLVMVVLSILAPLLNTIDPKEIDPRNRFLSPSMDTWFGSDNVGRDVYSRTIYGTRVSLIVGFAVAVIATFSAAMIGVLSGYYRKVDAVLMRVMDGLMSIPSVLLAMALMALLGGSVQNVIIALCVVETPRAVRIVRSSVLSLREQMFVDAAKALGTSPVRILYLHILPNTLAPLIVQATYIGASAVLVEAYLSFLGAGPPPDVPSWGNIMAEGRNYIRRAVWVIFFPGVFLTLTVLGINLAGDGLRDNLDPRLRRRM